MLERIATESENTAIANPCFIYMFKGAQQNIQQDDENRARTGGLEIDNWGGGGYAILIYLFSARK